MKCMTIVGCSRSGAWQPKVENYIEVVNEPYSAIELGESGRGRKLVRIPVENMIGPLIDVAVAITRDGNYKIIPATMDSKLLLLKCCVPAGFRGYSHWTGVDRRPLESPTLNKKWDYESFPTDIVIIGEGTYADGSAGRMSSHSEKLLILEPGQRFRVTRAGRIYDSCGIVYVRWDGRELYVGDREEVLLDEVNNEVKSLIE